MALTRDAVFWNAFREHAEHTVRAARLLEQMLAEPDQGERLARDITDLENAGDKIAHTAIAALHQTWITPLDRDEIHQLMGRLDDILDNIEACAERLTLYELTLATPEAKEIAAILTRAASDVARAVTQLSDLKQADAILKLCVAINTHEHDADVTLRKALARLFREEKDPIVVIKWKDVYEILESATDRAEDVANIIEGIVLEHA